MLVDQYIILAGRIVSFNDLQANLLKQADLVVLSETMPARLETTPFVQEVLASLTEEEVAELLLRVASVAAKPPSTPRIPKS